MWCTHVSSAAGASAQWWLNSDQVYIRPTFKGSMLKKSAPPPPPWFSFWQHVENKMNNTMFSTTAKIANICPNWKNYHDLILNTRNSQMTDAFSDVKTDNCPLNLVVLIPWFEREKYVIPKYDFARHFLWYCVTPELSLTNLMIRKLKKQFWMLLYWYFKPYKMFIG